MLDLDKFDDLSRLYRLFIMVPEGLPTLRRSVKHSIAGRGKDINASSIGADAQEEEDAEDAKGKGKGKARPNSSAQTLQLALKWVEDVLQLKDKFDALWTRSFQSNRDLESGVNEVSQKFFTFKHALTLLVGIRELHQSQREGTRVHFTVHR